MTYYGRHELRNTPRRHDKRQERKGLPLGFSNKSRHDWGINLLRRQSAFEGEIAQTRKRHDAKFATRSLLSEAQQRNASKGGILVAFSLVSK
jgi:hypothetical protein